VSQRIVDASGALRCTLCIREGSRLARNAEGTFVAHALHPLLWGIGE